jgi:hypothetical protein
MPFFKLKAGGHTSGEGAEVKFFRANDPKACIVESEQDLATLEPARWEPYEGPLPEEEETEPEPPPPPPSGEAEQSAARELEAQLRPPAPAAGAEPGKPKRRRHAEE